MAQFLYWLDRGAFAAMLQHAGVWVALVAAIGAGNIIGIAALRRYYDDR